MKLYFEDSEGDKILLADDIEDEAAAASEIIKHQRSRFIYQTGVVSMIKHKTHTSFVNAAGVDSGYVLEK